MTLIVGVDPSAKKIAIVWHDTLTLTSGAVAYTLYKTGSQTSESLGKALDCMDEFALLASRLPADRQAWVELPVLSSRGAGSTVKQSQVRGIICGTLVNAGFVVYGANVTSWKKEVCGHGSADKAAVARAVRIQWPKIEPVIGGDGDLTDAAGIALYGKAILAKAQAIRTGGDA